MNVDLPIKLAPTSFCAKIGWSDSKHNIKRLEECILRLQGAFLIVRTTLIANSEASKLAKAIGAGWTLGFVTDFEFEGVLRWTVQLNPKLTQLFLSSPTYLIIAKRQALTAGLQTWLYGYIEANTCTYSVSLQTLADAAGSTASLKEFARQVRDAIPKLIAARVLCANSTVKNGKVSLFKVHTSASKRK
ncbi:hypothetical protein BN2497_3193 [Janthinobacterium sp. CG23_2]|nr:hypothetical protein BN2497_3193 [Janthinobacterium sp. CG23_2]CUU27994.1 hypothetical protein BN3177_3193 [Janthinobacterium sp. CG23_2]